MLGWLKRFFGAAPERPAYRPTGRPSPTHSTGLPARVLAIDVETTGLGRDDRVVSFAGILLDTASLSRDSFQMKFNHLIFNPDRDNHPQAERVHGYSDWTLRHQESFAGSADDICELIDAADLIVGHNVAFDIGFISRELAAAGRPRNSMRTFCTMEEWRRRGLPGSASLTHVSAHFGLARTSDRHGALEDAWLALMVFLRMSGRREQFPLSSLGELVPRNFRPAPPAPPAGKAFVEAVAAAKREGRLADAEALLLAELGNSEILAARFNAGVSPRPYEQLAIIYARQKRKEDELAILARYFDYMGDRAAAESAVRRRFDKARAAPRQPG